MADVDIVKRTAALARLRVEGDEAERLARDFARILEAFRALAEADLPAPAEGARRDARPAVRLRADEPEAPRVAERLVDAAPEREDGLFRVPKAVDREGA